MITEDQVEAALQYLCLDPHPLAETRFKLSMAENRRALIYAELFTAGSGAVEYRKACVEKIPEYQSAKSEEARAEMEVERQKAKYKSAEMIIELWRTESANVREAGRIR